MSVISGLFGGPKVGATDYGNGEGNWHPLVEEGGQVASGVRVNATTAMKLAAVFGCIKILSETLASLPLIVYKRLPDGGKERAFDHPLYDLLHNAPNDEEDSFQFIESIEAQAALRGNGYAEIITNRSEIVELKSLMTDRMQVRRLVNGVVRYTYSDPITHKQRIIPMGNIFHIRGLSTNGLTGISTLMAAKQAIGLGLAAEEFGASFYGNGATMGNILEHPAKLSDGSHGRLKQSLKENHAGPGNAHKTLILEEGMTWRHMGLSPDEAQFLATRKFQVTDIARFFRVPPHMLADLDKSAFSNIEQQSLEFVVYTMMPWILRWEQKISQMLFVGDSTHFAEFLVDGLLRGDAKTRALLYSKAIQWGWMNRNEVRGRENMNDAENLDDYLVPMNMGIAGQEPPEQVQTSGKTNDQNFGSLIDDAAERIASAEERAWERHSSKAGVWVDGFKARHLDYIEKVITPLLKAKGSEGVVSVMLVSVEIEETLEFPVEALEREDEIKEILERALCTDTQKS